jgi:hypothetical protein
MEAKELRIGNYVMQRGETTIVKSIKFSLNDWQRINGLIYKSCTPIPLTEEWHNKFGVEKNGFYQFEYELPEKNNFKIRVIFNHEYVTLRQGGINQKLHEDDLIVIWNKDLTKRDMYLHEWQNLYFALTGQELFIKNQE